MPQARTNDVVTSSMSLLSETDLYTTTSPSTSPFTLHPPHPHCTTNNPFSINRALYTPRITSAGPPPRFSSPRTPRASPYIASTQEHSHIRHHVCRAGSHPVQEEGQLEQVSSIPHRRRGGDDAPYRYVATSTSAISAYLQGANSISVTPAARSTTTMRSPPPSSRRRRSPTA